MQGPSKVVTAVLIDSGSAGTELRVYFEPEASGDLLSSQVEEQKGRVRILERRADRLRNALLDQGWVDLPLPGTDDKADALLAIGPSLQRLWKAGAIGLGLVT